MQRGRHGHSHPADYANETGYDQSNRFGQQRCRVTGYERPEIEPFPSISQFAYLNTCISRSLSLPNGYGINQLARHPSVND